MSADDLLGQRERVQRVLEDLWERITVPPGEGTLLTTEVHIPTAAGSLRVGRDSQGLPHLLIPAPALDAGSLRGTAGVSAVARALLMDDLPVQFLDLGCQRTDLTRVFAALAVDICLRVAAGSQDPAPAALSVLDEWRTLLERRSPEWTRSRVAGLFAEIVVLERLLAVSATGLRYWTGPAGQAQDFRGPGGAVEVKATVGGEGRVVRIHGSDQLEEPAGGELHLAWFRLDDEHPAGLSVRLAVDRIAEHVADSRSWAEVVLALGLPPQPHPEIDGRRFQITEERWFRVGPTFPRIVPASFVHGAVPAGVGAVEYLLDLDVLPVHLLSDGESALAVLTTGDPA